MKRERNAKQAFIEGTVRVVARDGLDKTTTKAIATEAGLSEAYIYRCFESKEALLCAAFHMEDVAFAYFLKQNLVGMHIQNAPWKDRAFQLWSASWRFILGRKDDCLFYLRYYYSANCRTYAYEEHLQCFQELFSAVEQTFKPEANVNMLLHQVFDTMLSFAARVLGGEMPDDDATTQWAFEQTGYNLSSRNLIWDVRRIGLVVPHNGVNDGDHLPAGVAHGRHVGLPFISFFLKIKL